MVVTNNLKEGLTKPVALEGNVEKNQNVIMYHFYLFSATYCKKEIVQTKNWPGCKQKWKGRENIHKTGNSQG